MSTSQLPNQDQSQKDKAPEISGSRGDFQDPTHDKIATSTYYPTSLERQPGSCYPPDTFGTAFQKDEGLSPKKDSTSNPSAHYQAHPFAVHNNPFHAKEGAGDSESHQTHSDQKDGSKGSHNPLQHQLPAHEEPAGSRVGVGSLPGSNFEAGVVALTEEREGGTPYGSLRTGFEDYSPAKGALHSRHNQSGEESEDDLLAPEKLNKHALVHEHVAGHDDHHVMSKWEMPTHEVPSGSRCGVGSLPGNITEQYVAMLPEERIHPADDILRHHHPARAVKAPVSEQAFGSRVGVGSLPGKRNEQGVAMLPEEHLHPADDILGSHLPLRLDQMPIFEHPSGSWVGVGSLPGGHNEQGVAMTPEERLHPADDILGSHLPPRMDQMPLFEHPSGSKVGVGSLPGKRNEQGVAMLPEERLHPANDILMSHLPPRMDEMPSTEHPSGSTVGVGSLPGRPGEAGVAVTPEERIHPADGILGFHGYSGVHSEIFTPGATVGGVGDLPGKPSEQRVALLPEERLHPADDILMSHLPPRMDQMPSTEHPSGSIVGVGSLPGRPGEAGVVLTPEERIHPADEIMGFHGHARVHAEVFTPGATGGVGDLPGKPSEQRVALLPEERLHPADEILMSHLPPRMDQMPSMEHLSGSVVGVGSLPGKRNERGVALLPEEKFHPADQILGPQLPPRMDQMPSMEHSSGSMVGVGSLPGPRNGKGVAILPDEGKEMVLEHLNHRFYHQRKKSAAPRGAGEKTTQGDKLGPSHKGGHSHHVQHPTTIPKEYLAQMPTTEKPSGSSVGIGSLPGPNQEAGVAILPDERRKLMRLGPMKRFSGAKADSSSTRWHWYYIPLHEDADHKGQEGRQEKSESATKPGEPHDQGSGGENAGTKAGLGRGPAGEGPRAQQGGEPRGARERSESPMTIFNADRKQRVAEKASEESRMKSLEGAHEGKRLGEQKQKEGHGLDEEDEAVALKKLEENRGKMIENLEEKRAKMMRDFEGARAKVAKEYLPPSGIGGVVRGIEEKAAGVFHGAGQAVYGFLHPESAEKSVGEGRSGDVGASGTSSLEEDSAKQGLDSAFLQTMHKEHNAGLEEESVAERTSGLTEPMASQVASPSPGKTPSNVRSEYVKGPGKGLPSLPREAQLSRGGPLSSSSTIKGYGGVEFRSEAYGGKLPGFPTEAGMATLIQDRMHEDGLRAAGQLREEATLPPSSLPQTSTRPADSKINKKSVHASTDSVGAAKEAPVSVAKPSSTNAPLRSEKESKLNIKDLGQPTTAEFYQPTPARRIN